MVFSLACASQIGYVSVALHHAVACGFGLVIVLLLVHDVYDVGMLSFESFGERVAIADDGLWLASCLHVLHASSVAADEVGSPMEDAHGDRV